MEEAVHGFGDQAIAHRDHVDVVADAVPAIARGRRSQAVGLVVDVIGIAVVALREPAARVVADVTVIARPDIARTFEAASRIVGASVAVVEAVVAIAAVLAVLVATIVVFAGDSVAVGIDVVALVGMAFAVRLNLVAAFVAIVAVVAVVAVFRFRRSCTSGRRAASGPSRRQAGTCSCASFSDEFAGDIMAARH
jgi:hypothetical protein